MDAKETLQTMRALFEGKRIAICEDSTLSIRESDISATLKVVHLVSLGAEAFSIKFDSCGFPGQVLFAAHPSLHRACDAIAFCVVGGDPYILCCELKSSEPMRKDVVPQFHSAHCFLDYLNSVLKQYASTNLDGWPRRYFVFHGQPKTPVGKQTIQDEVDNDTPEKAWFVAAKSDQNFYLRQLIGKTV